MRRLAHSPDLVGRCQTVIGAAVSLSELMHSVLSKHQGTSSTSTDPFCIVTKHFCGPATDAAVEMISALLPQQASAHAPRAKVGAIVTPPGPPQNGFALATCCHGLCVWPEYTGKAFLLSCGVGTLQVPDAATAVLPMELSADVPPFVQEKVRVELSRLFLRFCND
eukprot:GCRY01011267.1.p1 GENE.GCRY01011267.1~~GCRY01011267.1.p1  ORF type:complete len:166 (+),score=20.02 GCRY01011267.1:297-794(+)